MMPLSRPTMAFVERVMMLLGMTWLGPWQKRAMEHLITHRRRTLKMPRQTGKSECVGLYACCLLLLGFVVTVLMPTYTQAQRILFRDKISAKMRKLEHVMGLRRVVDTTTEVVWANGAALRALSINDSSQKEGYTTDEMIIDEGHNAYRQLLDVASPFITQAKRRGTDGICVLGVGGMLDTLIECLSADGLYEPLWITPQDVTAADPSYVDVFEEYRRTMTAAGYAQMVECKPVVAGLNSIFGKLPGALPSKFKTCDYYFGIDVGYSHDDTILTVLAAYPDCTNLVDEFKVTYGGQTGFIEQARRIYEYIDTHYLFRPENIGVEVNGLGVGLWEQLNERVILGGYKAGPIVMTEKLKRTMIEDIQRDIRGGYFGVALDDVRRSLEGLTYEIKDNGKIEYQHSDRLSALLVARAQQLINTPAEVAA